MELCWILKSTIRHSPAFHNKVQKWLKDSIFFFVSQSIRSKVIHNVHIIICNPNERRWFLLTPVNKRIKSWDSKNNTGWYETQKVAEGERSPHLSPQWVQLAVKLLVGFDLLIQFSLQLLFGVFQTLDLLLCLVHLSLRRLQSLSQLRGFKKKKWHSESRVKSAAPENFHRCAWATRLTWSLSLCSSTCSSSACIFISFTLRSSLRFACCRLLLSLRAKARRDHIAAAASCNSTPSWCVLDQRHSPSYNQGENDMSSLLISYYHVTEPLSEVFF